jgi:hypothetical protein
MFSYMGEYSRDFAPGELDHYSSEVRKMLGEQLLIDGDALFAPIISGSLDGNEAKDKRQSTARSVTNVPVRLRPANTSQRSLHELLGRVKDLSTTGCGLILNYPPHVGDIYRFQAVEGIASTFEGALVRCVRCHFIDEEVFEAGFQFLTPLRQDSVSDGLL